MTGSRAHADPAVCSPAVTVLVPTRDRARYLGDAIGSVLGQTFTDLELVVIDDGSTDDTRSLVCAVDDRRLRYVYQAARGMGAALNRGLRSARGRYVARLDSDDVWTPDMLATLVPILESHSELGVVYARGQAMDESGRMLPDLQGLPERFPGDSLRSLVYDDATCNVALVARRECFERAGFYDEDLVASEDWDMWLRVARHYRFAFVDKVVARIRWHDGNLTGPSSARFAEVLGTRTCPLDKLFRDPDLPPAVRGMRSVAYANVDLFRGQRWLQAGKPGRAVRSLGSAVRTSEHPVTMLTRVVWFTVARPVLGRWAPGRRAMDAFANVRRRRRVTHGPVS
jgi:glycosyltransferase involved in cell wall biosynthesis